MLMGPFPLVCSAENAKRFAAREGVTWVLEMAFCNPHSKATDTLQLQVIHAINSDRVFYVPSFPHVHNEGKVCYALCTAASSVFCNL